VSGISQKGYRTKLGLTLDQKKGVTKYRYVKPRRLLLKTHPEFNERWVQEKIAEDPSILGIGELILKDKERNQPSGGRLDLLFQALDANTRYEIEIQLGKTDECHIFRALEYWDLERKRFPQYDHVAVVIAEDITSRFLNIISILNSFIPLMAIQLNAIQFGDQIALIFNLILDQRIGIASKEEEEMEVIDRTYWEKRTSRTTVCMVNEIMRLLKTLDQDLDFRCHRS
jgi:hypothetical protein